jgi:predicted ATP-dependent endonuclease of OLD family
MRLKSLALKNFRCFTDEKIEFNSYTALVGANRLHKNPMVLEGALENIHKKGPIPHLEQLCSAILAAF